MSAMLAEAPARAIRVGGINIAPGEARTLSISLATRASDDKTAAVAVPAWAAVGPKAGPRVSIVGALHGYEAVAARAAAELTRSIDPAAMSGSLVVVPVMRAGGRFAPGERVTPSWAFPGDAGGTREQRDAFALFSEVTVGSTALILLAAPPPGRCAVATVRAAMDNPRTRRLVTETGAAVALATRAPAGSLRAAAGEAGVSALELRAGGAPGERIGRRGPAGDRGARGPERDRRPAARRPGQGRSQERRETRGARRRGARRAGGVAGAAADPTHVDGARARRWAGRGERGRGRAGAPGRGAGARCAAARRPRDRGEGAARRVGPRVAAAADRASEDQAVPAGRAGARRRRAGVARHRSGLASRDRARAHDTKVRAGWVEHVALPNLGIARLKAKIDTGARTSALHVARMKTVDTAGGPGRRPILEITVPGGPRGKRPTKVRAAVREYVVVRDTSGRMERRPVIETALRIGPFKKRILVTLTNRGDMLFPMLIGRTALGPGIVVDPSRRYLLSIS